MTDMYEYADGRGDLLQVREDGSLRVVEDARTDACVELPDAPEGVEGFIRAVLAATGCAMSYSTSRPDFTTTNGREGGVRVIKRNGGNG